MKFTPTRKDYTLAELSDFVQGNHPSFIEMSEEDEHWYRNLFSPEAMLPSVVTFHGIPVVKTDRPQTLTQEKE